MCFFSRFRNRREYRCRLPAMQRGSPSNVRAQVYLPPRMIAHTARWRSMRDDAEPLVQTSYSRKALLLESRGMRRSAGIVELVRDVDERDNGMFDIIPEGFFQRVWSDVAVGDEGATIHREAGDPAQRIRWEEIPLRVKRRRFRPCRGRRRRQRMMDDIVRDMSSSNFFSAEVVEDRSPQRRPERVVSGGPRRC